MVVTAKRIGEGHDGDRALVIRGAILHKPHSSDMTNYPDVNPVISSRNAEFFASVIVQIIFAPSSI